MSNSRKDQKNNCKIIDKTIAQEEEEGQKAQTELRSTKTISKEETKNFELITTDERTVTKEKTGEP